MREIKFRVYSKSCNKMFDNKTLESAADGLYNIAKSKLLELGYFAQAEDLERGIYLPTKDEDLIFMQYTGIKDKNGKEIYEGDIVKFLDEEMIYSDCGIEYDEFINTGKVFFSNDDLMGWDITNRHMDLEEVWHYREYIEVIGNIYENPELLG